ncbi:hypothetical protein IMCC21906_00759 [Spongiibacter sp. IMCC21906]|nr:hypothetical protein IMCC21906_00759 [Spongiibacter sp. IMCC21906]
MRGGLLDTGSEAAMTTKEHDEQKALQNFRHPMCTLHTLSSQARAPYSVISDALTPTLSSQARPLYFVIPDAIASRDPGARWHVLPQADIQCGVVYWIPARRRV